MFPRNPARLSQFDYLGFHRYFLTFCTFERHRILTTAERVAAVRTQILRACTDEHMAILADCYMPDHLHLLVQGQAEQSDGRRFIARAKQLSGFHYRRQFGERLWQRYSYERVLRTEEDTWSVARYILENPVRAGLVARIGDYPFLGSMLHTPQEILESIQFQNWRTTIRSR